MIFRDSTGTSLLSTAKHAVRTVPADPFTASPTIVNTSLTQANTVYHAHLTGTVRAVEFQCRNQSATVIFTWTVNGEGAMGDYMTLAPGSGYWAGNLEMVDPVLYFSSDTGGVVMEIAAWL